MREYAPPMSTRPHIAWYHGSPLRLSVLEAGSTVTPIVELARAFSHKPSTLGYEVREMDGARTTVIDHYGSKHGYLYRVVVGDPTADLSQHPGSGCAPGEEMLTTRDLVLEFLEDVPLGDSPIVIAE